MSGDSAAEPRPKSRRGVPWFLIACVVAYVALRALVLLTSFEDVVMAMFEQYPMGTMAQLALEGVDFPVRYYYDNAAGQLVMGHLAIPFYAVLGPSYLVLKLLPALLGLATLVLLWDLLDRHVSRTAANLGALLFAVAPSTLVRYSVVCSGNHFENLFFSTLFLWLFLRHHGLVRTKTSLFWAWFGAGLAVFVFLGAIIVVGICAGVHVGVRGLRRALADAPVAIAGFFVGILPLLVINAVTSGRGLGFLSAKFEEGAGRAREGTIPERIGDFLGAGLRESGMFEAVGALDTLTLGAIFVAAFALAYVIVLPRTTVAVARLVRGTFGRGIEVEPDGRLSLGVVLVPFVLYVPLAALAYGIANFRLRNYQYPMVAGGYRYYLPTLLCALVLISVVSARAWDAWRARSADASRSRSAAPLAWAGAGLYGATLLVCATSWKLVDWSFDRFANGLHYEGYNYAQMARGLLSRRNGLTRAEIAAQVEQYPPHVRERVVRALGFNLGYAEVLAATRDGGDGLVHLEPVLAEFPAEWRPVLAHGVGTGLRHYTSNRARPGELPGLLEHVTPRDTPLFPEIVAGSAQSVIVLPIGKETIDRFSEDLQLLDVALPDKPAFRRGLGTYCGRIAVRGVAAERAFVEQFASEFTDADFQAGYRRALAGAER